MRAAIVAIVLFCALSIPAVWSQVTGTATLNIGTQSPPPPGGSGLLSGCVVNGNTPNCGTPGGWTLSDAQGFDSGSINGKESIVGGPNPGITTAMAHTGSSSLQCRMLGDGSTCQLGINEGVIGGSNHIYVSYWRYMDPNACGGVEIYFADVYTGTRTGFFNVEDTQNSPGLGCLNAMQVGIAMFVDGVQFANVFQTDYRGGVYQLALGRWQQIEFEFQGSTCSGSTSNNDGLYRLYLDGSLTAEHTNFNLNGCFSGFSSVGMAVEAGPVFTWEDANGNSINAGNGAFNTYIDDVILLSH